MATFTAVRAVDMIEIAASMLRTYKNGQAVAFNQSAADIHIIGPNTPEQMVLRGHFTSFSDGKPTSGSLNTIEVSRERFDGTADAVATFTGLNSTIEEFRSFVGPADASGLLSSLLSGADTITGSASDDVLYGFGGNDLIDGGGGVDSMAGGVGNDRYVVETLGDTVVEASGAGIDRVNSTISFTLGNNVENLTLVGAEAIDGTGNGLANLIAGNGGDNRLNGRAGSDRMVGGSGDDSYVVESAGDRVVEASGAGTDQVTSSVSHTLSANVENLILAGAAAIDGTGNALSNLITGNGRANLLNGRGGSDRMVGGNGNDSYAVESTGDRIVEASGAGTDQVTSSVSHTLSANVENLTLAGAEAINGTGNGMGNIILGNGGANRLNGGAGADQLQAKAGNDKLFGGLGADELMGGAGADRFYFDTALSAPENVDELLDFRAVDDTIFLDRDIFGGITANGTLKAAAFSAGTHAIDASDRIIYDQASGNLFYDADGLGGAAQVLFAVVADGTHLTRADFSAFI